MFCVCGCRVRVGFFLLVVGLLLLVVGFFLLVVGFFLLGVGRFVLVVCVFMLVIRDARNSFRLVVGRRGIGCVLVASSVDYCGSV